MRQRHINSARLGGRPAPPILAAHAAAASRTGQAASSSSTQPVSDRRDDPLNRSLDSLDLDEQKKSIAYQRELLKRVHEERNVQNEALLTEQDERRQRREAAVREEEQARFQAQAVAEGIA